MLSFVQQHAQLMTADIYLIPHAGQVFPGDYTGGRQEAGPALGARTSLDAVVIRGRRPKTRSVCTHFIP